MKAGSELRELHEALRTTTAACDGDVRFTADHDELGHDDTTTLRRICLGCPVYDLCLAYAVKGRPTGGVWAGRRYSGRLRTDEQATGEAPWPLGLNETPADVSAPARRAKRAQSAT